MRHQTQALSSVIPLAVLVILSPALAEGNESSVLRLEPSPAEVLVFGAEINGLPDGRPTMLVGDKPISGNRVIAGWREAQVNGRSCWVADLPDVREGNWSFRQIFVNGQRRHRPRLPKQGFYRFSES